MSHTPRKRFGQNFLRDESVIASIAKAGSPVERDPLVEIGPGEGALTEALITSGCQLDAVELDRDLRTPLLAAFSTYPRFTLHSADALAFDFTDLIAPKEKLRVVGNLPYNISTPLIALWGAGRRPRGAHRTGAPPRTGAVPSPLAAPNLYSRA